MPQSLYCFECIHYAGQNICLAFPKGIPENISSGNKPHKEKIKGQEGDYVHKKIKSL
jgi:hypothetical protein